MSPSLEMFSLCHMPLVDLGQRFLCNLAAITTEGCSGKKQSEYFDIKSRLAVLSAEETLFVVCLFSPLTPVTRTDKHHCSYLKWQKVCGHWNLGAIFGFPQCGEVIM